MMRIRRALAILFVLVPLALCAVACSTSAGNGAAEKESPAVGGEESAERSDDGRQTPGAPQSLAELERAVQRDLAERLGLDVGQIEVVSREAVEWPDASLGCPRPGESYAQMITPGYRVVLQAQGREYRYHTRGVEHFVLCGEAGPEG